MGTTQKDMLLSEFLATRPSDHHVWVTLAKDGKVVLFIVADDGPIAVSTMEPDAAIWYAATLLIKAYLSMCEQRKASGDAREQVAKELFDALDEKMRRQQKQMIDLAEADGDDGE